MIDCFVNNHDYVRGTLVSIGLSDAAVVVN